MIRLVLSLVVLAFSLAFLVGVINQRAVASPVPRIASCGAKDAQRVQPSVIVAVRQRPYCVEV